MAAPRAWPSGTPREGSSSAPTASTTSACGTSTSSSLPGSRIKHGAITRLPNEGPAELYAVVTNVIRRDLSEICRLMLASERFGGWDNEAVSQAAVSGISVLWTGALLPYPS